MLTDSRKLLKGPPGNAPLSKSLIDMQLCQSIFPFMEALKQERIFDCLAPRTKTSGASCEMNAVIEVGLVKVHLLILLLLKKLKCSNKVLNCCAF